MMRYNPGSAWKSSKFKVQGSKLGVCPAGLFIIYGWAIGP
jgi:hypothetical protein